MTEREIDDGRDYPDGSVGRYVRERWGTSGAPRSKAPRPYAPPVQEQEPEPAVPPRNIDDTPGARTPPLGEAGVAHPNGRPAASPGPRGRDGNGRAGTHPEGPSTIREGRHGAHRAVERTDAGRDEAPPDTAGPPRRPHDPAADAASGRAPGRRPTPAPRPATGSPDDGGGRVSGDGTAPDRGAAAAAGDDGAAEVGAAGAATGATAAGWADAGRAGTGDVAAVRGPVDDLPAHQGVADDDTADTGSASDASAADVAARDAAARDLAARDAPVRDGASAHGGARGAAGGGDSPSRPAGGAQGRASDTGPLPAVGDGSRGPRPGSPAAATRSSTSPWAAASREGSAEPSPPFSGPRFAPPPSRPGPAEVEPAPARPAVRDAGRWTDPGAVAAQEAQQARAEPADLSSARLLRPAKRPPQSGWRRLIYLLSGRTINPGESPVDVRRRELTARVNAPLLGCYKIAMLSLKGGVGKTTMTATLGATFASLRGDRVVAVDANPDRGTLSQKIPLETSATVRHLLRDAQRVRRYTDVRAYTSQGPSRLEVLASEQDPAVSEAFSEDDYRRTVNLLEHFYNIVLTDCGTGLMHSAMYGVLGVADQLIIVSSGSIDGARSASATMDWLDAHGHGDLVRGAVAVINSVHRSGRGVDLDRVEEHFAARCRAVVRVPFDAHLDEGAEIDLDRLEPGTRMALLELAAYVADAFDRAPAR